MAEAKNATSTETEEIAHSVNNLANRVNDSDALNALAESVNSAAIIIADRLSTGIRDGLESAADSLWLSLADSLSDGKPHPGQKDEGAISISGALLRISASLGSEDRGIRGGLDRIADALQNAVDVSRDMKNIAAQELTLKQHDGNALVGKFFHSWKADGRIDWQGEITAEVAQGVFLVQRFEWAFGAEAEQHVVPIQSMAGWHFYDSAEEMSNVYREYARAQERKGK